jgi:hypothetical protein
VLSAAGSVIRSRRWNGATPNYSRQADRINTQPDPLRGEGGHDAELATRISLRPV